MHADGTSVRHVAAVEEESRVGENGGEILSVQISPGMFTQMVGIQQPILRAAGAKKKGMETRADKEGTPVS